MVTVSFATLSLVTVRYFLIWRLRTNLLWRIVTDGFFQKRLCMERLRSNTDSYIYEGCPSKTVEFCYNA